VVYSEAKLKSIDVAASFFLDHFEWEVYKADICLSRLLHHRFNLSTVYLAYLVSWVCQPQ
jgi:hypothetical protein